MWIITSAFWTALDGRCTLGKANAPPSTGWQLTPGRLFTTSENLFRLRAIEFLMFSTSCRRQQKAAEYEVQKKKNPWCAKRSHKSHHVIKWVWGISQLWWIHHYIQSNLTQHWWAGLFREQFIDVFQDFWVYIYQFYISSTQTTPGRGGRSQLSIVLL